MSENYTVQDVFNAFCPGYQKIHELSAAQRKAAYHIMNCKTGAFGANVSVCEDCGCISIHYNSCRDRCCPMCQEFPKEKWVDARREDLLDAPYFHVVFTVSAELNPVIYSNQGSDLERGYIYELTGTPGTASCATLAKHLREDIAALLDLIQNDKPGVAEKVAEASKNI